MKTKEVSEFAFGTFLEGFWKIYDSSPYENIRSGAKNAATDVAKEFGITIEERRTGGQALMPNTGTFTISKQKLKEVVYNKMTECMRGMKAASDVHDMEKFLELNTKHLALVNMEKQLRITGLLRK